MGINKNAYYSQKLLRGTVAADGTCIITDRQPDIGEMIVYNAVVVENTTAANCNMRIGVRTPFNLISRYRFINAALDVPQTYDTAEIIVTDDNYLEIDVTNGTENDVIEVNLFYRIEKNLQDN